MTMQLAVESLVVVTYSNVPVITTGLLANLYKTEEKHIRQNFKRNECRFIAGKHFFKVSGCELDSLRTSQRGLQISPKTRSLILWTERGAARHAKMLETDQAWEVFEKLEDCYFSQGKTTQTEQQSQIQPQFTAEEIILLCYMQLWMEKAQDLSKHLYPIMKELNSSYTNKLYDIAFETIYMVTKNRDALLREAARLDQSSFVVQRARPMLKSLRARPFEF
ncbi:ORF6N domain-containing protein [Escherichia coli]